MGDPALLVVLLGLVVATVIAARAVRVHPLVSSVSRPDRAFAWAEVGRLRLPLVGTAIRIRMTSQVWQGIPWTHELDIVVPRRLRDTGTVLLLITGGSGDTRTLVVAGQAANATGIPVAVLFDIPNQPLFAGRTEDALIAYTFEQFLKTGDSDWPLLFPMTKSAVRAMDAVQEFARSEWQTPVNGFVVTGASKRGWTTWLTGAVDERVIGIAPMVYDNLNLPAQMRQQVAVYGGYSEQIADYSGMGLPQMLETPQGQELGYMVDPYSLRLRLTVPKLLVHGSNDAYWTLESAHLYLDDLPGDLNVLTVPNVGHDLGDLRKALGSITAFARARMEDRALPAVAWRFTEEPDRLRLTLTAEDSPRKVAVWVAASETQDFRQACWTEHPVAREGADYAYALPRPASGYAAVFGEITYHDGQGEYWLSTAPRILGAQ